MAEKLYKLTDADGCTYGGTQWGSGVTHTAPGTGELCSNGWIHAYTDAQLAVLLNPIHADFETPRLWLAEGDVGRRDGLKVGCMRLTTVRELVVPTITTEQYVRSAILCSLQVYDEPNYVLWARRWLDGSDRAASAAASAAVIDLPAIAHEACGEYEEVAIG